MLLWRDQPSPWLADLGSGRADDRGHWLEAWSAGSVAVEDRRDPPLQLDRFAVSVLGTIRPNRLSEALESADDGLAARFLYSWPDPPPYCPLRQRRKSKADEGRPACCGGIDEQVRLSAAVRSCSASTSTASAASTNS